MDNKEFMVLLCKNLFFTLFIPSIGGGLMRVFITTFVTTRREVSTSIRRTFTSVGGMSKDTNDATTVATEIREQWEV